MTDNEMMARISNNIREEELPFGAIRLDGFRSFRGIEPAMRNLAVNAQHAVVSLKELTLTLQYVTDQRNRTRGGRWAVIDIGCIVERFRSKSRARRYANWYGGTVVRWHRNVVRNLHRSLYCGVTPSMFVHDEIEVTPEQAKTFTKFTPPKLDFPVSVDIDVNPD